MAYIQRAISEILKSRVKTSKCTLVVGTNKLVNQLLLSMNFLHTIEQTLTTN